MRIIKNIFNKSSFSLMPKRNENDLYQIIDLAIYINPTNLRHIHEQQIVGNKYYVRPLTLSCYCKQEAFPLIITNMYNSWPLWSESTLATLSALKVIHADGVHNSGPGGLVCMVIFVPTNCVGITCFDSSTNYAGSLLYLSTGKSLGHTCSLRMSAFIKMKMKICVSLLNNYEQKSAQNPGNRSAIVVHPFSIPLFDKF